MHPTEPYFLQTGDRDSCGDFLLMRYYWAVLLSFLLFLWQHRERKCGPLTLSIPMHLNVLILYSRNSAHSGLIFSLTNILILFPFQFEDLFPTDAHQQRKISVNVSAVVKSANIIQYIIHLTWQKKAVAFSNTHFPPRAQVISYRYVCRDSHRKKAFPTYLFSNQ